jgi:hypothetical protein
METPAGKPLGRSSMDDVIDAYKRGVDRTLLREALKLTPSERISEMIEMSRFLEILREAGRKTFG